MKINNLAVLSGDVVAPKKDEQRKIADFLNSLGELATAETKKLDALKIHKNGLIQQLFTRGKETVPQLRFPGFSTNWKEEPLHSIAEYENGKAYEQYIHEDGKFVVVNSRFISTEGAVRKYSNAEHCLASKGDVLMVLSDLPNGRALAKCFYVESDGAYAVNQRVARLTPTSIHSKFFYYRLNRHSNLLAFDDGLNQTHLSKQTVTECPLIVPSEQAEQQKIADCLSSIDDLITAQNQKIEALKTLRKGLMQQMFPVLDEVSA